MQRSGARTGAALALGVVVVAFLISRVGVDSVWLALTSASPAFVALSFVSYAVFFVLRGARWRLLLASVAPNTGIATATSLSAFGWLVSTFIPFKAGDAARAALLSRRERTGLPAVVGTVAVERLMDLLGLAALASFGFYLTSVYAPLDIPNSLDHAIALAWLLPLVGVAVLFGLIHVRRWIPSQVQRIVGPFLDACQDLPRAPARLVAVAALTLLVAVAQASVIVFLFLAFEPQAQLALILAGAPLFLLSFIVSITPGNVGTYEAAFVAVFALLGFDPASLAARAVLVHLLTMSTVVVLGGLGFAVFGIGAAHPLRRPRPEATP